MDIERFKTLASDPRRTITELITMKANAQAKGRDDLVQVVDEVLRDRNKVKAKKSGGKTPTTARFRHNTEAFDSGKDAYLWLIDQFWRFHPSLFDEYEMLHSRAGTQSKGRRVARNPKDLFPTDSTRQGNPSFYAVVGPKWYADVNLNHDDKFATLIQLSHLCELKYEKDWDFKVFGATEQLIEHQRSVARARRLLDELLAS
jgi:hypothetical protein